MEIILKVVSISILLFSHDSRLFDNYDTYLIFGMHSILALRIKTIEFQKSLYGSNYYFN